MATFKAEVQNKRADGTYNIRIRVTHNRVVRRISTNLYATGDDLTKGLKIKNVRLIVQCEELIQKCREICNALGYEINALTTDELVEDLKMKLKGEGRFKLDFIQYMREKAKNMSEGTGQNYRTVANILERFSGNVDILDINYTFLKNFEAFIAKEPNQKLKNKKIPKGDCPSQNRYMSCVRAIHNQAKLEFNDEDRGIIRIPQSPFSRFKIKKEALSRKRALTVDQIQRIIDLPYSGKKRRDFAKDCFILSFALIGINSVDMYYAGKLAKGILKYNRRKTTTRRVDKAEMQVKAEGCLSYLMEKYQDDKRLFRFYKKYSNPSTFNIAINKGLKMMGEEIGVDDLEYYAARHSWATIARSAAVNIDKATVSEALNHANNTVTDIYIDKDWQVIWNANAAVLALFDWSAVGYDVL
ncbi:MAG: hypothetical protein FDW93_06360 [Bergeyella sp.]|nr:hypothetical protein [Bergeyella sp.]